MHSISREIFWTLALFAFCSIMARLQYRRIHHLTDLTLEQKRQKKTNFRNGLILGLLCMLGFVWGGEIRSLILSLAAIAAAIMIVSKEIISCFYGAFILALSKPARIGDSIEIGPHKGELLDHNWLTLTLMEHSDTHYYSGKTIKIPNSLLLTTPLVNLSQGGAYRFCTLVFHARQENATISQHCAKLAADQVCVSWVDDAKIHAELLHGVHLTQAPDAEPKATLLSQDKDTVLVSLRFPAPAGKRATTCAEISRIYHQEFETYLRDEKLKESLKSNIKIQERTL